MSKYIQNSYINVYETMKRKITAGEAPTGSKLPSDSSLATRFDVPRPTVAKAVKLLRDDRLDFPDALPGKVELKAALMVRQSTRSA